MKRGTPRGGYDTIQKADYRKRLWSFVDRSLDQAVRRRRVLYLDTGKGLETRLLLRMGYRPSNLNPCNFNRAEAAVLTRRLRQDGLPDVQAHGSDLLLQAERGDWDVISYDSVETLCDGLLSKVCFLASMVRSGGVLTVTMQGGREKGDWAELLKLTKQAGRLETHEERLVALLSVISGQEDPGGATTDCRRHIVRLKWDGYQSPKGTPMLWVAAQLRSHKGDTDQHWFRVEQALLNGDLDPDVAMAAAPRCVIAGLGLKVS